MRSKDAKGWPTRQTVQKAFVQLPGGSVAIYNSNGLAYYRHPDWLGSSRLASTLNRATFFTTAYGPFGEAYASTGTTDLSFTGMNQDTVANLYDFPAREYGIQGRWPSPDPAGLGAIDITDPQSFDRYGYVGNQPLAATDPLGLRQCLNVGPGGCHDGGGGGGGLGTSGGCVVDGVPLTCDNAITVLLSNGVALVCPSNNCSQVRMGDNGYWQIQTHEGYPGINGYGCGVNRICSGAAYGQWADVTWVYMQQQTQIASQLSTPSRIGTWWLQTKVFFSRIGANFTDEFKPNGCFAQFANQLVTGQAADASPPGAGAEDIIRNVGKAGAATYALNKGLSYPLRSSIYRGILGLTETAAAAATIVPVIHEELKSGYDEMKNLASGKCK